VALADDEQVPASVGRYGTTEGLADALGGHGLGDQDDRDDRGAGDGEQGGSAGDRAGVVNAQDSSEPAVESQAVHWGTRERASPTVASIRGGTVATKLVRTAMASAMARTAVERGAVMVIESSLPAN
jgi:hypothetical protein